MSEDVSVPDQWIEQTQGLVRSLAYGIHRGLPRHVPVEDIIGYGQVGLLQAAQSYRAEYEVSFQTFAYYRIRGAMLDGLGKMAWANRAAQRHLAAERAAYDALEHGTRETEADRGEQPKSPTAAAGWLFRTTEKLAVVQLLGSAADDGDQAASWIEDEGLGPDERVAQDELKKKLKAMVQKLPEAECSLIELTYYEGNSLAAAARKLGRSKSWASRLHAQILQRLARSVSLLAVAEPKPKSTVSTGITSSQPDSRADRLSGSERAR